MASEKQVSANRRNASKSTGPTTQNGKLQSRCNAMRHGLTAATVVPAIEDAEEFERFEAAIRGDYQPVSTIEHELVARLTSLLWRLIPKLRNLDSYYPTLCGDDRIVNVSQIKHLDGRRKPAATPQVGRG
jgi:hypothetical protein